jgi:hypothetical protein
MRCTARSCIARLLRCSARCGGGLRGGTAHAACWQVPVPGSHLHILHVLLQSEPTRHSMLRRVMVGTNVDDNLPVLHHLLCPPPRASCPPNGVPLRPGRTHGPYGQWLRSGEGHFYNTYPRLLPTRGGCQVGREIATSADLPELCNPPDGPQGQTPDGTWSQALSRPGDATRDTRDAAEAGEESTADITQDAGTTFTDNATMAIDFAQFVKHLSTYVEAKTRLAKKSNKGTNNKWCWASSTGRWSFHWGPLSRHLRAQSWKPSVGWRNFWTLVREGDQCCKTNEELTVCDQLYQSVQPDTD